MLGLIRPKIYLPVGLNASERSYILLHEQTHINRKDHIIKVLALLILSVHWFNPLAWIAFMLMGTDMELSCDERVLKEMDEEIKKSYANSLLSLATGRHILNGSPLAFGEGNVKGRIKNVLNYRKPTFWIILSALVIVAIVSVGLLTNPKKQEPMPGFTQEEVAAAHAVVEEYFRSIEVKDDEAILKTLTPIHNQPNVVLYRDEILTLLSIDYNEDDPMRKIYVEQGRGNINGTKIEDVIVFKVSFNVKYAKGDSSSFNEGDYTNWSMILIRDGKEASWFIDGQGY
ncbi:MAG: M56 family metallopeptidase [Desulfitobacteriaceae bacterium]|nr:M56 family metallopeptidase [Desulfitobacteriaceae bacterium]